MNQRPHPFLLLILDGFGYREDETANAIAKAKMPHWKYLWQNYPHLTLSGSGLAVGLPAKQMGNSEVGHLTIGAGRIIQQDLTRVDEAITNGTFFENPYLHQVIQNAEQNQSAIHLMGLLSSGGVHSHENHFIALIDWLTTKTSIPIYLHAFLDGRDTPPQSAMLSLLKVDQHLNKNCKGKIASIIGRFFAMDRDQRYERTQIAYELLTEAKAPFHANSVQEALELAYQRGESDEFVQATTICSSHEPKHKINDGDAIIFMNFRADRARQLTAAFINDSFTGFSRTTRPKLSYFLSLTEYAADLNTQVLMPSESLQNSLGEYLAKHSLTQFRIAETEKYAHVTFFFNGGRESPFVGEDRILIPSPKVTTYDLKPEMSVYEVTKCLIQAIEKKQYDIIICNFANPDMVGHTGNFEATVQALEAVDQCIGNIFKALQQVGGEMLITADHGNAEFMYDAHTQQPHTAHTTEPVPLLYVGRPAKCLAKSGQLSDIAPTLLSLMGLPIPNEMTGKTLFKISI